MAYAARVHSALLQAGHRTEQEITKAAREHAVQSGWPKDAAKNLRAHVDGGHFHMSAEGAEDWEYGTEDRPPLAAGRHFENRAENLVNHTYVGHLERLLGGLL